ncbi:rhomboid family intramembrane serine protease [Cyanobacteria bacterium FACHB-DQ100]|uniref:rhomboid family intramembrane serine protease n=1 Tax=Leptolyngbya sp. DQ-M1 TaxID=2933920 RepID=UPI001994FF99|nr:rhomboid family intramembrane serine protease [Cyanobacteria bacterium FACHB-DQ100]
MFPVSDDNPTRITPYVTLGIIAANILVFLYQLSLTPVQLENFFYTWAVVPRELTASLLGETLRYQPFPEWITLVTSQFLHGGFAHIAGNMLFLWIFGNNVEERLGHIRFLIFYIGCGVLAVLAQWFFSSDSNIPSLGASGAIAGVMGAYILRFPGVPITTIIPPFIFFPFRIPAWAYLGIWFIQQAFYGVASLSVPTNIGMERGGVAYWAHAGGFVFGAILGPLLGLFSRPEKRYSP